MKKLGSFLSLAIAGATAPFAAGAGSRETAPTPSSPKSEIVGIIFMSVALGTAMITAFDKWLRDDSGFWLQAVVCVAFAYAISFKSAALMKRVELKSLPSSSQTGALENNMGRKWVRAAVAVALIAMIGFAFTVQLREGEARNQAARQRTAQLELRDQAMQQAREQLQQNLNQLQLRVDEFQARMNGGRPSATPGAK
jgi:hypothetical protein